MSLTGIPLILLAFAATVATLGGTVLVWRRWGRWQYVVRPAGVLLAEALLTATVGLAVNRSQQFYPTWPALFATSDPGAAAYRTTAGRLDAWLARRPDPAQAQGFPWQPAGWRDWRLAAPPSVTVPAGYLRHPAWRYSAVLVVADAAHPWPVPALAGPTVLVSVITTAATEPSALEVSVPGSLGRDLRVTGHRWALVTSAADNTLARRVVAGAGGRYPAVAFVGTAGPAATAEPAGTSKAAGTGSTAAVDTAAGALPSGVASAYFPAPATTPAAGNPAAALARPLRAAMSWAAAQTPPPLAPSAPEPTYLPIPVKRSPSAAPDSARPHPGRAPARRAAAPHVTPTPPGGPDGSGQPRP